MQKENLRLKKSLILQAFAPLFVLLAIKHLDVHLYLNLIQKFVDYVKMMRIGAALETAIHNSAFGGFVISIIGIVWFIITVTIAFGFGGFQKSGFVSAGEKIKIEDLPNDNGATFLVTYVLPLITDDVNSIRGLIAFLIMLTMIILLLTQSNNFYQNPVLSAMKYRTFSFKFSNPSNDIDHSERVYIGITCGTPIVESDLIKRKYISDGVFVVYND